MAELEVIETAEAMQARARELVRAGRSIGFVPTMGALHAGHRSLVERARKENDVVVVSIYVNPTQFGPNEDFERYPRTFDADRALCQQAGADIIWAPKTLYHADARTWVEVGGLGDTLCGLSRPGHFRGVSTVVTKLLSVVRPDRAYFGRKDAQQLAIIQALVRDLCLGCEIVPCETVREPDGLAMSSRNRYLSPAERQKALSISRALQHCADRIAGGERNALVILGEMAEILASEEDVEIDYCALVDAHTLEDISRLKGDVLAAIAVKIGTTRLIDNRRFEGL